ncbi:MAG: Xaa-Pro peptidase family protein [Nitrospirae bacterium]|jgi:Xaa-Pro aminopeptidase|nr:Xaa-Pro peptidase family protein [Nitrospirota bacterium]
MNKQEDSGARLIIAAGEASPDLYYRTRFLTPDPYIYLEIQSERIILVNDLEIDRARKESIASQVLPTRDWEKKLSASGKSPSAINIVSAFLEEKKILDIQVPFDFPLGYADGLRKNGFNVTASAGPFFPERAFKSRDEARQIRTVQIGVEESLREIVRILKESNIRDGLIHYGGTVLTSETVKSILKKELIGKNLLGEHTIVAGGEQACDPHMEGEGPLPAHLPIVFDIFPHHESTRYFADMTRTLFKGSVKPIHRKLYETVLEAQEKAISLARPEEESRKLHQSVVDVFEARGYRTGEKNGRMEGFFHGTGHGVGLEIHEAPRVGKTGELLKEGHVITVEPGLYYPGIGGVRIEDMLYITDTGFENLTTFPKDWGTVAIP